MFIQFLKTKQKISFAIFDLSLLLGDDTVEMAECGRSGRVEMAELHHLHYLGYNFLLITKHTRNKIPRLFWLPVIAPLIVVVVGCVFAYLVHAEDHGNLKNEQTDGNKEMIAFGLMNILGSFISCYLTTAVNYHAGCKTQMSNVIMAICMMLSLELHSSA